MAWSKKALQILIFLGVVSVGLRVYFVQTLIIHSHRFSPVLLAGDLVVGGKQSVIRRGDLVSFECMERPLCVGHVLGLPGDRLDFEGHQSSRVNDNQVIDRLFSDATRPESPSVVVSPDTVFVEGDQFGEILASEVTSRLSRVVFSVDPSSRKLRGSRIWMAIR